MDIDVFESTERPTVMRALRTALAPSGPLGELQRRFLDTYARIAGWAPTLVDPEPIAPDQVHLDDAHRRKRLVQLAALAVLLERPVRHDARDWLAALARHLAVRDSVIGVIDALSRGRVMRARMLAVRRLMRVMLGEAYTAEGVHGVLRLLTAMLLQRAVNRDRVWDYKRLGLLPDGTLGREYWKHMTQVGFPFPGEPAGIPHTVAFHDIGHVLAGHEATPLGEIQQGSFQGGNRREGGFIFVLFVVLQFHHGIRVTVATTGREGHFDPALVLWALHRGARCTVDMTHQWDYWPLMTLPLEEARRACGLLPKLNLSS